MPNETDKLPADIVEEIRAELAKSVQRLTTHPDENRSMGAFLALQFILGADLERFKKFYSRTGFEVRE